MSAASTGHDASPTPPPRSINASPVCHLLRGAASWHHGCCEQDGVGGHGSPADRLIRLLGWCCRCDGYSLPPRLILWAQSSSFRHLPSLRPLLLHLTSGTSAEEERNIFPSWKTATRVQTQCRYNEDLIWFYIFSFVDAAGTDWEGWGLISLQLFNQHDILRLNRTKWGMHLDERKSVIIANAELESQFFSFIIQNG